MIIDWRSRSPNTRIGPSMLRFHVGDTFEFVLPFSPFSLPDPDGSCWAKVNQNESDLFWAQKPLNRVRNQLGSQTFLGITSHRTA